MKACLFDWLKQRSTGVLVHPTCLPNEYGIGTLGNETHELIEFMVQAGLSYWQVCPLSPTGYGDSPYSSFSAFAGNPNLIDTTQLVKAGLITDADQAPLRNLPRTHVDFIKLSEIKSPILKKAFKAFKDSGSKQVADYPKYATFVNENEHWLDSYAAYMACKYHFDGKIWSAWAKEYQSYESAQKTGIFDQLKDSIDAWKFYQYVFFSQWNIIRKYANSRGVAVIGDIPIFVSFDSADMWANKSIFQVDANGKPTHVAGVPPDYFSETGQLWGNPLYDWDNLKKNKYEWWLRRFEMNFDLYDVVRVDHFRGFYDYWKIPANAKDARIGTWAPGPKIDFFQAIKKKFPKCKIIAEDLGDNMSEVFKFRDETGLPGMVVLQFGFGGGDNNPYLPQNYVENSVVYPGTHDNDTTLGWFNAQQQQTRDHAVRVVGGNGSEIAFDFIRMAYKCKSRMAIVAIQDFMSLPTSARFNIPGTAMGNWKWRYQKPELDRLMGDTTRYLKKLAQDNSRIITLTDLGK